MSDAFSLVSIDQHSRYYWVDSLVKRLDDDRYAVKITARKPTSKWSDLNRKRWSELKADGLLQEAGLSTAPTNNT